MADDSVIRQAFDLPHCVVRFEFRIEARLLSYEFDPDLPRFGGDRGRVIEFMRAYSAARREFLETVATATGLTIAIADELPDGTEAVSAPISPASVQ